MCWELGSWYFKACGYNWQWVKFCTAFNSLDWICISCFGNNLGLAINKALILDHVHRAVKKCCSVVELLRPQRKQVQLLIGDVATRWGSTYNVVSWTVEQQQAICAVLAEERKDWHPDNGLRTSTRDSKIENSFSEGIWFLLMHCLVKTSYLLTNLLHLKPGSNGLINEMKHIIRRDFSPRYNAPEVAELLLFGS